MLESLASIITMKSPAKTIHSDSNSIRVNLSPSTRADEMIPETGTSSANGAMVLGEYCLNSFPHSPKPKYHKKGR